MSDAFVGEIRAFGFNFAPTGWALCNGQLLPISQNTALFSLLGTTYGGDGKSTFALPDLQGNAAAHPGQGPGLSQRFLGEEVGSTTVTLIESEMPLHAHGLNATSANGNSVSPAGGQLAKGFKGSLQSSNTAKMYSAVAPASIMSNFALAPAGGGQPHNNMMPFLAVTYCIALQGIFPPRG